MDTRLDYYTAIAERDSGFWIGLPVNSGKTVARDEWLRLVKDDPDHFQVVTISPEDLMSYLQTPANIMERAVFVMWSDEMLH